MKKAIIIPASYKGTLSSIEVGDLMAKAVKNVAPDCQITKIPISDGGEGCVDCFISAFGGKKITLKTFDPYEKPINSFYGRLTDGTAIIEMAASAGLPLVKDNPNPSLTTTYGVGQLIKHAVQHGSKKIIIGLGGSCTNDAGVGLAQALGVEFFDHRCRKFLPTGGTLNEIHFISTDHLLPEVKSVKFTVLCDVKNTFSGPTGAAYVFAKQKGADEAMIKSLDENLAAFSSMLKTKYGFDTDFEGAGAAGGTTVGLKLFLNATIKKGIDTILDMINFDRLIKDADVIFTGEGRLDKTSFRGKVIDGIAKHAFAKKIPLIAICGQIGDIKASDYPKGLTTAVSLLQKNVSVEQAIKDTPKNLLLATEKLCRNHLYF